MDEKLVSQFKEKAQAVSAEVIRAKTCEEAYQNVLDIVAEAKVKEVGCVASGLTKSLLPRLKDSNVNVVEEGAPEDLERLEIGIIPVDVGIAETGTVAHDATNLFARYFSMLCPTNIVLLKTKDIEENMLQAIKKLEQKGTLPAYTAFITGPSRTADIERVLTIGVHGPGRLVIILVDEEDC
ncbi:MAG: lactate utilization protein [Thermoanaerobacteraceae bacterium]|nr:lactate utilization protein [Thermoanaerobacteraceae bacterium]